MLSAFRRVPRERFVSDEARRYAYENRPLPIGHGQTISQPLMVAIMLEPLSLKGEERVLEIGTGSGYQAALLSLLAREVVSVERVRELAESGASRLSELGYANVKVFVAGEVLGWPAKGPYDAIVVSAGAPEVPSSLVDQLAMGGRMVVPVGGRRMQQLVLVTKTDHGVTMEKRGECRFVPLIARNEGWSEWPISGNGAKPS